MRKGKTIFNLLIALTAVLCMTACSSRCTGKWASTLDAGSCSVKAGKKVMVAGVTDNEKHRAMFEEAMCAELGEKGIDAFASTSAIPDAENLTRKNILEQAEKQGADFAVISRIAGVEKKYTYFRHDPMLVYKGIPGSPCGELNQEQEKYVRKSSRQWLHVKLNTKLYKTGTGEVLWSGVSETSQPADSICPEKIADSAAKMACSKLTIPAAQKS